MKKVKSIGRQMAVAVLVCMFVTGPVLPQEPFEGFLDGFDANEKYDIYYQVSENGVNKVSGVTIRRVVVISNTPFLEISPLAVQGSGKKGYIAFNSVKAMFPAGLITPGRILTGNGIR